MYNQYNKNKIAFAIPALAFIFLILAQSANAYHIPPQDIPWRYNRVPIAAQKPIDFGICTCDTKANKLTGPSCKLLGQSCSANLYILHGQSNCICGFDGILTGLGCPAIGQPCYQNQYKHPGPPNNNIISPNFMPMNFPDFSGVSFMYVFILLVQSLVFAFISQFRSHSQMSFWCGCY